MATMGDELSAGATGTAQDSLLLLTWRFMAGCYYAPISCLTLWTTM